MLGAEVIPAGGVVFSAWAPRSRTLAVRLVGGGRDVPMDRLPGDVFSAVVPGAAAGARYFLVTDDGRTVPDPRSRFQPDGVHGPSMVVDPGAFAWRHPTPATALGEYVIYELHVGAFSPEGTFAGAAARLPALRDLGVTAIELMPVAAFPGDRNWGYDGVYLSAPCAAYGAPDDLRALIDTAHGLGLCVVLDVVYNHLGPEGNYTGALAPYFTSARRTPWGDAIDYERREVREWIADSAAAWRREYRVDALRVDAVHAVVDPSPRHVLAEACARARPALMIAETDMNDVRVFEQLGFDACWSDDFHHALHACLTGERGGYYRSFGDAETLARAIEGGWIRGESPHHARQLGATRLVVASQTHDQVGNRARGDRLEHLAGAAAARLSAVATLAAAPAIPLLFMGEEWGATARFPYFTSHGDPELARAVSASRRRELAAFAWQGEVPDPQDPRTFAAARLDWRQRARAPHAARLALYRDLLALRRARPDLGARGKTSCHTVVVGEAVFVHRSADLLVVLNLSRERSASAPEGLRPLLHSADRRYGGALEAPAAVVPPREAAVFARR